MTQQNYAFSNAQSAPHAPGVEFWNTVLAPKLIRFRHVLVPGLARHSQAVFPDLPVKHGDHVMDVGCGFGDTAVELARRVGPDGAVLGVDCTSALIDEAREYATDTGAHNVTFQCHDAEQGLPVGVFDFVFARFGTMFFANPVSGLRNMRKSLKPGASMTHVVWRDRRDNPWLSAARDVVLDYLPAPDADAPSCGPGPFSMADQDLVTRQMTAAGFENISFRRVDVPVLVGGSVADAIEFQLALGPVGEIYRMAGEQAVRQRPRIERDLRLLFQDHVQDAGVWMDSSSWVITATSQA